MLKALDKWLPGYLRSVLTRSREAVGTRHLIFCICDHFEPFRTDSSLSGGCLDQGQILARSRESVRQWLAAYPGAVAPFRDVDGRSPCHTFFYPAEEYDPDILDQLANFCRKGHGEVEIHLHHRHDTPQGLREKIEEFRDLLHRRHGLLGRELTSGAGSGQCPIRYGFIHGNWALCNSRPDGDWCGVNEELGILAQTGCYADFTFPSAPSPTQPRMVNAIYRSRDVPGVPRGADRGEEARVGGHHEGKRCHDLAAPALLVITGPLALNWHRRKWGLLPRIENAEITEANPPTPDRIRLWSRQQIRVVGCPAWVFVKVHTHGCLPANAQVILGAAMREAHAVLTTEFNDGRDWQLHYVSAREMYNLVRAAEAGCTGSPDPYRDYEIVWERRRTPS